MKIATPEIRSIVVTAYLSGTASRRQLADIFCYHIETIGKWIRAGLKGRFTPLPRGHRIPAFNTEELEQLAAYIERKPDATLSELSELREHFGKECSLPALHKIIRKMALVLKKTLRASEQEREDIANSRDEWRKFQGAVDAHRLVFLDESGLKTNMTRLYGRARNGNRCFDSAPCGHWETVTILSSIRLDGTTESLMFEGAVDRKMFDAYIKEGLAPTLRPGDIVIMDNLKAHKSQAARDAIRMHQAEVLFLPAYSPDFNPIEQMWSKMKQVLRGIKPRTGEELFAATGTALDAVNVHDAQGWFTSSGYTAFQS
jgi:transposase